MCGIFGWILPSQDGGDLAQLTRLTDLLSHRGPDAGGYWIGGTTNSQYQIGLGNRRLSIIDIPGGLQPMWSRHGDIVVVYNGEIYNFVELRAELQNEGHEFATDSDTEVLIESYRKWGPDAVKRFRGMFAFALWDSNKQLMLFARDPFGKKPLFLLQQDRSLLFSSEVPALLRFPAVVKRLNYTSLSNFFRYRYCPGPETLFQGIEKLLPGHIAVWHDGILRMSRYFVPPLSETEPDVSHFEDAVEMLQATLDESVRIRMRSDAPFGAFLSGGLDSSAVVSSMVQHSAGTIRTYSAGFVEREFSELEYAKEVATLYGTDHHELVVEAKTFFAAWAEATRFRAAPVSETADVVIMLLSRLAHESVKMVLTGEGADELLGGYPKHRAEPWVGLYQKLIPPFAHDILLGRMVRALPYSSRRIKALAVAAGEREFRERMAVWFGGMSTADCSRLVNDAWKSATIDGSAFSAKSLSPLRRILFFDQSSWLPDNLLERGDRMMMSGSIEGRTPFMDVELAKLTARFPDHFLIGAAGGKSVLRAALKKRLPQQILNRPKIGFRVPIDIWFRGPFSKMLQELLLSDDSKVLRLCNAVRLRSLVEEHMNGKQDNSRNLWSLASLEVFLREFGLHPTAEGAFAATREELILA